jgi:hypothetical protein
VLAGLGIDKVAAEVNIASAVDAVLAAREQD